MRARLLTLLAALTIAVAACTPADEVDNDDLIDPGGIPSPGMSDQMMSDDMGG